MTKSDYTKCDGSGQQGGKVGNGMGICPVCGKDMHVTDGKLWDHYQIKQVVLDTYLSRKATRTIPTYWSETLQAYVTVPED